MFRLHQVAWTQIGITFRGILADLSNENIWELWVRRSYFEFLNVEVDIVIFFRLQQMNFHYVCSRSLYRDYYNFYLTSLLFLHGNQIHLANLVLVFRLYFKPPQDWIIKFVFYTSCRFLPVQPGILHYGCSRSDCRDCYDFYLTSHLFLHDDQVDLAKLDLIIRLYFKVTSHLNY